MTTPQRSDADRTATAPPVQGDGWGDHSWAQDDRLVARTVAAVRTDAAVGGDRARSYLAGPVGPGASTAANPVGSSPGPERRKGDRQAEAPTRRPPVQSTALIGRGLPALGALLVLAAVLAVGIVVDQVFATSAGLSVGLVVGSLVAVVAVRMPSIFAVLVAPPLAYVVGSAAELIVHSAGMPKRAQLLDFATGWLVYGFPTIAVATATVALVALLRRGLRR